MKKFSLVLFLSISYFLSKAQSIYVDVATPITLGIYAGQIKDAHNETNEEISALKRAQQVVSSQMILVNRAQDRLYRGLKEVNGTIRNGLQVKRLYDQVEYAVKTVGEISRTAGDNPQYTIFATKATQQAYRQALDVYTEVADIINSDDTNLATAGDRYKILDNISMKMNALNLYLYNVKYTIERAKRIGFWRSINPFNDYYLADKDLFQAIITNAGGLR